MDDAVVKKMIHDLMGPISVIGGFLRTLDLRRLSEEDLEYHSVAMRSVERIMGMIREMEQMTVKGKKT